MINCECIMPDAWSVDYIRSHWRKLEEASQEHSVFQSWAWIDCWLEIAKKHVRPILFKDNGKIVGLCFVGFGKSYDCKVIGFKTFFPFLSGTEQIDIVASEYNSVLCLPEYKKIVNKLLVQFFQDDKRLKKYARILLKRIPESQFSDYQQVANDNNLDMDIYKSEKSAYIDLKHLRNNALDYNHGFSKSLKSDIRRSEKLYIEKYGVLKFEKSNNVTQAQNWFQELGKLNKIKFQAKGEKSAWDYPELIRMHRAFLNRHFASGNAEIVRLCAGSTTIGYLYNFIYRGVVYFYMGGFLHDDDNRLKPGLLTHDFTIKQHFLSGNNVYDFMAGEQSYKYRMGACGVNMYHLTITEKNLKLKCAHFGKKIKSLFVNKNTKTDIIQDENMLDNASEKLSE